MGGTNYSSIDKDVRDSIRDSVAKKTGISVDDASLKYNYDIRSGKTAAATHPTLSPRGVKVRESRDSKEHPITIPIGITLDTTGSMSQVPYAIQKSLTKLMGTFLEDKASGKRYLGDGYPAIMISAVDDYDAQQSMGYATGDGCLQIGQFESGLEIDDNLSNLWITKNGGGTAHESYDLALYFAARHTVHDHLEQRGKKGYWFIIGDEMAYPEVTRQQIMDVIGDDPLQSNITLEAIIAEASEKYHIFFILPNQTSYYSSPTHARFWQNLLPEGHFIKLADPNDICSTIVGCVALCEEEDVTIDDLKADGVAVGSAIVPLSAVARGAVSRRGQFSAAVLPTVGGTAGSTERL